MRSHRLREDGDLIGVDLLAALQPFRDGDHRALVIVRGQLHATKIAHALTGPIHHQKVHAAIQCVVYLRIRIDFLGHVATGDKDHGRRFRSALHQVEVALELDAFERDLDALDRVGGELDDLLVVSDAASVQVALSSLVSRTGCCASANWVAAR